MHELAAKVDEYARGMISGSGSSIFEEIGLYCIGPIYGHNIDDLVAILPTIKISKCSTKISMYSSKIKFVDGHNIDDLVDF